VPTSNELNLHMVAAEAAPFAKVGGLADVVAALPRALEKLGARTTIMIPAYRSIHHDHFGVRPFDPLPAFDVPLGMGTQRAEIFQTRLPGSEVEVFLIGCLKYFFRDGIYDDPLTGEGFRDNMERFIFFSKAAFGLIRRLGRPADVIHCHDAQTGLIPGFLWAGREDDPFFRHTGSLFTIHNLAYQSIYPKEALILAGIPSHHYYAASPFEFWDKVNFMKVGIECADLVNTVSVTYASEIQSGAEFGHGLETSLAHRKEDLFGIVNGLDYGEWNPETDPHLTRRYSADDLSGKDACKSSLRQEFGLPAVKGRVPLIGMVTRLADQKGLDLVAAAMESIASLDLQLVMLGQGQHKYRVLMQEFAERHPGKIAVRFGFDNSLAHRIEAGADMFLMPSKYEPCGLNQLISMRYGTVPIVRLTGGLADTVADFDLGSQSGTGFVFKNYTPLELLIALRRALLIYSDEGLWQSIQARCMSQDWSWDRSARAYMDLYRRISDRRH